MAKFPLDLSKFKKTAHDAHSTTLQSSEGHSMTIAHAPLSPKFREQLAALPVHKADGGEVDNTPDEKTPDATAQQPQAPVTINIGSGQIPMGAVNPNPGSEAAARAASEPQVGQANVANAAPERLPYGVTPEALQASPAAPAPEGQPTPSTSAPAAQSAPQGPSSDPYGTQAQLTQFEHGSGEYKAGLAEQAAAEGKAATAQAAALASSVAQQKAAQQTFASHYTELDNERKQVQQDIQNQHIDPNHFMGSLDTGQRISTAIGLLLGGIGAGMLHQENPALKYINSQISNDIEAQRAELGKKENLLSANLKQFGNMRDATDMTRVMLNDITGNQMKEAAAKAGSQEAKARQLIATGQFDTQNSAIIGQMAMRKSLLTGMQNGQVDPSRVVMALVPKEEQGAAYKELQAAQNLSKSKDNLLGAFDQLSQLNTVGNRITSPIQTPKQVEALKEPLLAQLVKDSEGRITPQDTKMIEALFPAPGDKQDTSLLKRQQLNKFISEKMNFPILQAYGINAGSLGRYSPQGQSKFSFKPVGK